MRRKAKVDTNQSDMVKALRFVGASVFVASHIGDGFPDLVVGWRGRNFLIEVKTATGKLTDEQKHFASRWQGSYYVCRDVSDLAILLEVDERLLKHAIRRTR